METTHDEFVKLKELKAKEKVRKDGVYIVFREYPYEIEFGQGTVYMSMDSIEGPDDNKRWVKNGNGRLELVPHEDMRKELRKRSEELFQQHGKLLGFFCDYFGISLE